MTRAGRSRQDVTVHTVLVISSVDNRFDVRLNDFMPMKSATQTMPAGEDSARVLRASTDR